jgi:hypothetical protein
MKALSIDLSLLPPAWRNDARFRVAAPRSRTRRAAKPKREDVQARLVRSLRIALTPNTVFFATAKSVLTEERRKGVCEGLPDLVFVHRGRAFGLTLKSAAANLTLPEREMQAALRAAGMRIEVARSVREAVMHLRDMGIPVTAEIAS